MIQPAGNPRFSIEVFDLTGRMVLTAIAENPQEFILTLNQLRLGIYLLRVTSTIGSLLKKIIIL